MLKYISNKPLISIHIPKTAGTSFEKVLNKWFNRKDFININNHPRLYKYLTPLNLDFFYQKLTGCGLYYHYRNELFNKMPRKVSLGKKYGLIKRKNQPECVHGHFDPDTDGGNLFHYYPEASQFITFLRDPLELQLSLYFYNRKRISAKDMYWNGKKVETIEFDGDIDRWVEERASYMLRFLPFDLNSKNFKEKLNDYFVHIGVTENMQKSVDIMANKLGFEKVLLSKENATERTLRPSESSVKIFKEKHKLEYLIYEYAKSLNI
ncbi:MAG: sulfotransferase family 2 domain-containing protein [Cyclobacteriaceae bacterium]|nr:sulfotransferase family 2 domain-containing protein [Cyclobacteriaceae bacterium]